MVLVLQLIRHEGEVQGGTEAMRAEERGVEVLFGGREVEDVAVEDGERVGEGARGKAEVHEALVEGSEAGGGGVEAQDGVAEGGDGDSGLLLVSKGVCEISL